MFVLSEQYLEKVCVDAEPINARNRQHVEYEQESIDFARDKPEHQPFFAANSTILDHQPPCKP